MLSLVTSAYLAVLIATYPNYKVVAIAWPSVQDCMVMHDYLKQYDPDVETVGCHPLLVPEKERSNLIKAIANAPGIGGTPQP